MKLDDKQETIADDITEKNSWMWQHINEEAEEWIINDANKEWNLKYVMGLYKKKVKLSKKNVITEKKVWCRSKMNQNEG